MKRHMFAALALTFLAAHTARAAESPLQPERGFASTNPARGWTTALLTGNGTMGAAVMGAPADETILLNHARLFMPLHEPLPAPNTGARLAELRQMLAAGEYGRASQLVVDISRQEGWGGKRWTDPFIPAGQLMIHTDTRGNIRDVARAVDFRTGVASVRFTDDAATFTRQVFVSRPDNIVAVRLAASAPGRLSCRFELAQVPPDGAGRAGIRGTSVEAGPGSLSYRMDFARRWPGSLVGVDIAARVRPTGGRMRADGTALLVSGADAIEILLRVEPRFDPAAPPGNLPVASKQPLAAISAPFDALLAEHTRVHGEIFDRMRLDLHAPPEERARSSEDLITAAGAAQARRPAQFSPAARALLEKQFDAARYHILCASGDLFPNLQGIWSGTYAPPWSGDFTQNGNVQAAIHGNLPANMPELLLPYFAYLESQVPQYRENARRLYNARGLHLPSRTSSHGLQNHFDSTWPMTFWTTGAAWASHYYYEYYRYTGDREFLATRAVPFMKESALFFEDFLIPGPDGTLLFSPSYSPENNPGNSTSQACVNATMDIALVRELLANLITACETLGIDPQGVARWKGMLARLPAYMVNADGALKEYTLASLHDNYQHRHASHLVALFDGMSPDVAADPALQAAFRVAADKRMEFRRNDARNGGEMVFGLMQVGEVYASLHEPTGAWEVLDRASREFWLPNLITTHNPRSIFNTDLSGAFPALLCHMLADSSQPGRLTLLPAWPADAPAGAITGLRCRGQIVIRRLTWTDQTVTAELVSAVDTSIDVRLGAASQPLHLRPNVATTVSFGRK